MPSGRDATNAAMHAFASLVQATNFPCVGAKSAWNRARIRFGHYGSLGDKASASRLCRDLEAFSGEFPDASVAPVSFVALFEPERFDEAQFEARLWHHLQRMHDEDRSRFGWDATVSTDPDDENFSFSIAGRAFFVVGMHPAASRLARHAPVPCLVFNFHDQFESLKACGKYVGMQRAIRRRDTALQGTLNPVLARFGEASEARQYAGRSVADDWRCPFRAHASSP